MKAKTMTRAKAMQLVRKRIRTLSDKPLQSNLEAFCGRDGIVEAYRQGVEEAHDEIAGRFVAWFDSQAKPKGDGE
jgi:hypothetical protein